MSDFDPSQYKDPPKGLQFDFHPDEIRTFLEKRAAEHDACAKSWQECADSEKQLRYYQAADFVAKTKRARENGEKLPPRLPLEMVRQGCLENVKNNELAAKNLRDLLIPHIAGRTATFDLKGALDISADITARSGPPPVDQEVRDAVDQEMAEEAASKDKMKGEPVATNLASRCPKIACIGIGRAGSRSVVPAADVVHEGDEVQELELRGPGGVDGCSVP